MVQEASRPSGQGANPGSNRPTRQGHFGYVESVGDGVNELRLFYGPGYRVYFTQRSSVVVILLTGGNKSSPSKDYRESEGIGPATGGIEDDR
ncbi:MAG: hypothetical protein RQ826_04805 [Xanthomonadales bacterium]|nr:hypothetical protein [Xanthomonadales bacterium]